MTNQTSPSLFPVLFIGHGSPMNAIEDTPFSRAWRKTAQELPRPQAIVCVSAHWETRGTQVTAIPDPRTIHDFGGFPRALYEAQYPAPGSPELAKEVQNLLGLSPSSLDLSWGLDHGAWSVLKQMYPEADIPVIQVSLDYDLSPAEHYELGKRLAPLRTRGVLILGSGNLVHNLGRISLRAGDFNQPFGFEWALEASQLFKKLIVENDIHSLADYRRLGSAALMAVPTPEHFLPVMYVLALRQVGETVSFFNDVAVAGSLTMTCLSIR